MFLSPFGKGIKHSQFFKEVVDIFEIGERSPEEIFQEMQLKERISTIMFRIFSWIFIIIGHFLVFIPLISLMKFIPFVAYLL
jgi:hypothetical protein